MIPVTQTITGDKKGNCLAACVASILELPIEQVPNFCGDFEEWILALHNWLKPMGLGVVFVKLDLCPSPDHLKENFLKGYTIGGVTGARGIKHAVVLHDGQVIHDPHPGEAVADDIELEDVLIFTVQDPVVLSPLQRS